MKRNKKFAISKTPGNIPASVAPTTPDPKVAPVLPAQPAAPVLPAPAAKPVPAPERQITAPPAPAAQPDVAALVELLRNGEFNARLAAAAKLGTLGVPEASQALIAALRDSTAEVAREAALALASDRSEATVQALSAAAENRDGYYHSQTQVAAIESLAKIGDVAAIPSLLLAIRARFADPSLAAIRAVAKIAPPEQSAAALTIVADNPEGYFLPTVMEAAGAILSGMKA